MLVRAASYGFIWPALPSLAPVPPSGPGWVHEIKHDGFRMMVRRDAAGVRSSPATDMTGRIGFR